MLDALKFVQGAVAKKDFVPALTHFRIANGTIKGYNGTLGICSPIALDLQVSPKAVPFAKAIQTCKDTTQLHVTPTGKLSIKSGSFRALVECTTEEYPGLEPEGDRVELQPGLVSTLKELQPFIAEDASRPWARGVLFTGSTAVVTNNIILIEKWLGVPFPVRVNIPRAAVVELIRIGEDPTAMQLTPYCATFHYPGDRWVRAQLASENWPNYEAIFNGENSPVELPSGFWEAVENALPFVDELKRVFIRPGVIKTHLDEAGAETLVPDLTSEGCFNIDHLLSLVKTVNKIDLTMYPRPCIFYGNKLRGAITGIRV